MSDHQFDDIHALSGAYAVDALDEVERARFERHLAGCEACQAEVAGLTEAASELTVISELTPPAGLRSKVLDDISRVRPLPPLAVPSTASTSPDSSATSGPSGATPSDWSAPSPDSSAATGAGLAGGSELERRRADRSAPARWSRGLVAAAAAAVLTITGVTIWRSSSDRPAPTVAEQVLDASDASRVSQNFPGGATATVVRSASLGKAVIVTSKMPAAPNGKAYQLWLQDATGHMAPAGVMPAGSDQIVVLDGDARAATGAGITVEPAGGSPQPTSDPIALFAFT